MYVCICANVEYMCTLVHCEYISLSSFKEVFLLSVIINRRTIIFFTFKTILFYTPISVPSLPSSHSSHLRTLNPITIVFFMFLFDSKKLF